MLLDRRRLSRCAALAHSAFGTEFVYFLFSFIISHVISLLPAMRRVYKAINSVLRVLCDSRVPNCDCIFQLISFFASLRLSCSSSKEVRVWKSIHRTSPLNWLGFCPKLRSIVLEILSFRPKWLYDDRLNNENVWKLSELQRQQHLGHDRWSGQLNLLAT